ncbi:hypothetical protein ACQEVZ_55195 [Dactylosporangium sp. CA-152071]|uniref:hypothetical protein n=1 Tax=Dactylosporangium sp. CA-152071 TaxID=3239933 RepID=UPI003D8B8E4D
MNADQFIASAQEHGQDAFRNKAQGRAGAAALHLGVMLEHLAKAYLVRQNPAYIVDARTFDNLLAVGGHARHLKPNYRLKTITAREALRRFAQMNPPFQVTAGLDLVIDARDGAAHAGDRAEDVDQIFHAAVSAAQKLLMAVSHDESAFWSDYAETVKTILNRHSDKVRASVQLRIDQAARDYKQRFGTQDAETTAMIAAALDVASSAADVDESARAACPACGHAGLVQGQVDVHWDADYESDFDGSYLSAVYGTLVLYPSRFRCPCCQLQLDGDELAVVPALADSRELRDLTDEEIADYHTDPDVDRKDR